MQIAGYKSIDNTNIVELGQINVLVGPNDSGKTAFLEGIYAIQEGGDFIPRTIRAERPRASVRVRLTDAALSSEKFAIDGDGTVVYVLDYAPGKAEYNLGVPQTTDPMEKVPINPGRTIPSREPLAFIYPLLSKRMNGAMELQPNGDSPERVFSSLQNLI